MTVERLKQLSLDFVFYSAAQTLQEELSVIPNTIVALPLAQHNWRDAVKLIKQQRPETKIVVIGYSLGANNATYVAHNVKHVDELIAIQASVWGRATALGENVDKAIEIYNPKFWRTAGLGAKRLVGIHFSYVANSDSHFYADDDPEVHNFVFNDVKKIADPTTPAKSVSGIQPEGSVGAHDMQKVKAALALFRLFGEADTGKIRINEGSCVLFSATVSIRLVPLSRPSRKTSPSPDGARRGLREGRLGHSLRSRQASCHSRRYAEGRWHLTA